ncbi:MAG: heavy metal translocating P-type ATPase [Chitinispirillales bacterium]|nr:heavy metal translocating P-type ATPase [Chitinispirillales bacterium]
MAVSRFQTAFLPEYAPLTLFIVAYIVLGAGVVIRAFKNIIHGDFFDENFLMSAATVGAFAIGEYSEAVGVMLFYGVGELFQSMAVRRSKASISRLMDIRPDYANLKRGGDIVKVAAGDVGVGDVIVVKPGERIPLDGTVIEGASTLDASALTGESLPKGAGVNDAVLSGCINLNGLLTVAVTKTYGESTASKIIALVESASGKKAKTENFITVFARYYTPSVVAAALLIAVLPPLFFNGVWMDWIKRGLIFLVVSCPCALVLSIPMSFFAGIGKAARRGILVKGGGCIEALSRLDTVVFDKTGTLTKGVFNVVGIRPANGFSRDGVLSAAVRAEARSNHPIALSVMREYGNGVNGINGINNAGNADSINGINDNGIGGIDNIGFNGVDKDAVTEYSELPGLGVSAVVNGKIILAGNTKLMAKMGVSVQTDGEACAGGTVVYVAVDGVFAGGIAISDEVKPDSKSAVSALKSMGVRRIVMLTGDEPRIASAVAAEIGVDEVYGGLLPHDKSEKVELLIDQKRAGGKLAFVGDGINDAPAIALADIGVAMGALGSDAAIEAADAVLMTDEPSKLIEAIDIARFTKKIVWQNIAFVLFVKTIFLALGAIGVATMWEAVFADVGAALIAVLNAVRIIRGDAA